MEKSNTIVSFRVTRWNFALTLLLIAICAFQPHAEPIENWSLTMWFWLTIPIFYPMYVIAGFLTIAALVAGLCLIGNLIVEWRLRHG